MAAGAAERILVEEAVAAQRHAGDQAVVGLALEHVGVLAVAAHQEQAVVPQADADGGARLAISRVVGQIVGDGEALVARRRADAAGQVHLVLRHVVPDFVHRGQQPFVAGDRRRVGHREVEVHRPHRVADHLRLFADRLVVLGVLAEQLAAVRLAALVEKEQRQFEVAFLLGGPVELDEGQLDLLVAAGLVALVGAENRVDVVGQFAGDLEQLVLAGGLPVGDRRLDQVAGAVQFVAELVAFPAILRLDEGVIGVEVAVRLLGGGDEVDDRVGPLLQIGVALVGQRVGDAFQHLVHVGIVVEPPSCLPFSRPAATAKFLMRPVISHWCRLASTVAVRLMRSRWPQKSSTMWTLGNGTGVSASGLPAPTGPVAERATNRATAIETTCRSSQERFTTKTQRAQRKHKEEGGSETRRLEP